MKSTLQLSKHPVLIIFYLVYFLLFISSVKDELDYERIVKQNGGRWPYGVREWDGVLLVLVGFIFIFISCINAIAYSKQTKFYLWLILFIIIPLGIWAHIDLLIK
jgi:hypothetical protein